MFTLNETEARGSLQALYLEVRSAIYHRGSLLAQVTGEAQRGGDTGQGQRGSRDVESGVSGGPFGAHDVWKEADRRAGLEVTSRR